jgi:hypothetical protein
MHIEKNVFENIFNTVMDMKRKTNDNIKARLDLALFCNRKNMELVCDESQVAKPRASFVLEKNVSSCSFDGLRRKFEFFLFSMIVLLMLTQRS